MAIAKQDFDQLMNECKVQLVGASENGLKGSLYGVLSEFLNDTSIWTECISVPVVSTSRVYPLSVSEGQIIRLESVSASPCLFIPALMPTIGELVLKNLPNNADTYYATVVKNVALPTSREMIPVAPDWLLPVWHEGIQDGLLGRMMNQPSKSYSNATQAAYHLRRFRDAIQRARAAKLRANTNGATAWRFPQSFRATTQQGGVPAVGGGSDRFF